MMNGWHLSGWEWFAAITAVFCVWLTVKNKISNWPWGIVSVLAYAWVFWQTKVYANMWLNLVYFLPCCIYGWYVWAKYGPTQNDDLPVTKLAPKSLLLWCLFAALMYPAFGYFFSRTDDPMPYTDGLLTALSIVGQYLQAKKRIENWWFWIVGDVIYVFYFFPTLHLYISVVVYAVFLVMGARGLAEWRNLIAGQIVEVWEAGT